ncbi:hypothetical protein HETIRDRAFT_459913 [Heterobasidion irregulare TC 32-1]|uniref:Methyltransferase n=1 Tax=Heterobasidion irregulare (strain TC 32-1) TaxID=747525 RepID=W4K0R1_HETIT|nr:uncharacterized protein HETIRDRAFT_459913 [Heterobasidion irregulare TC 32-1]ETW78716.1 hypothetical protein HETIRDRAFT_459913 [Heterobasidion irregulare TC 32-1]
MTRYYKEVEKLLKKHTGAKRVFVFDHIIRRPVVEGSESGQNPPLRGPVTRVHADQTYVAGEKRWPIENVVAHHPLAVADWRTVNPDIDLVHTRYVYRDREGSTFSVKDNPEHRWYYLGNQTSEEVTLIKCFDTDESKARLTPHSAFLDSSSPKDAPQRQSTETRCLVFDAE